jgi:hypothetical protein
MMPGISNKKRGGSIHLLVPVFLALASIFPVAASAQAVTHVIHISVDGLRPDAVTALGPAYCPAFHRLMVEGASTLNARTDCDYTNTLPNHACQMTGRHVLGPDGHGVSFNSDGGGTIEDAHGSYVAGIFDVVHDHGLTTALFAGKDKFALFDRSWNEVNGAPDITGEDDGRDKIDHYYYLFNTADLVDSFLSLLDSAPPGFYFLHLRDPDTDGHAYGWQSPEYQAAVIRMDGYIGMVFDAVESNPAFASSTAITVTADHGGIGTGHGTSSLPENYTVQLHAWGAGISAGGDVYELNPFTRLDPGPASISCGAPDQPVRNGETANLAASLLGLPPVPGSTIGDADPLRVTAFGTLPSVSIISPPDGSVYDHGEFVVLEATASSISGIAGVEFFIDWEPAGADMTPPYTLTWWSIEPLGTLEVAARAVDLDGYASSDMIRIEVVSTVSDEIMEPSGWDAPRVYPNPAGPYPNLYMYTPRPGPVEVAFFDAAGRETGRQSLLSPGRGYQAFELDMSVYAPGIYFFRAASGGGVRTGKFILMR